jgi:hypothetical protein
MKRFVLTFTLFALASPGCMELPKVRREPKPAPQANLVPAKPKRIQAPVTSSQVTEDNAQAKADALDAELARDEERSDQSALPAPGPSDKR